MEKLYLSDNYILTANLDRQLFLSRGGRKKYFISLKLIKRYFLHTSFLNGFNYNNYHESLELVEELLANRSIGTKTRDKLEQIEYLLNNLYEE